MNLGLGFLDLEIFLGLPPTSSTVKIRSLVEKTRGTCLPSIPTTTPLTPATVPVTPATVPAGVGCDTAGIVENAMRTAAEAIAAANDRGLMSLRYWDMSTSSIGI